MAQYLDLASRQPGYKVSDGNQTGTREVTEDDSGGDYQINYYHANYSVSQTFAGQTPTPALLDVTGNLSIKSNALELKGGVVQAQNIAINPLGGANPTHNGDQLPSAPRQLHLLL